MALNDETRELASPFWGTVIVFLALLNRVFPPDLEDSPAPAGAGS